MAPSNAPPNGVLVVDDEEVVLDVLRRLLGGKGMAVTTVRSSEEALQKLSTEAFGLVVIDKNLPNVDGIELLKRIRTQQPNTACIIITAYSSTATAVEALRLGAADYLEKPFTDLELVATKIETVLKRQATEIERNAFWDRLQSYRNMLESKQTEIDMFEGLLEQRVTQATADLKREAEMLGKALQSTKGIEEAALSHAEDILAYVRGVTLDDAHGVAGAREVLARVLRRLDAHVGLVRHLRVKAAGKPDRAA